jgi:hypothetical protein
MKIAEKASAILARRNEIDLIEGMGKSGHNPLKGRRVACPIEVNRGHGPNQPCTAPRCRSAS